MPANDIGVANACYRAGFRDLALIRAVAIACAEGDCDPDAEYDTRNVPDWALPAGTSREWSVGPFQFNLLAHPNISEADARDLEASAMHAYLLFRQRMDSFSAWSSWSYRMQQGSDGLWRLLYQGEGNGSHLDYWQRASNAIVNIHTDDGYGLEILPDGTTRVVPPLNAPDDESDNPPLQISNSDRVVAHTVTVVMDTITANMRADSGTAAQRAIVYNLAAAGREFLRAFGNPE